MSDQATSQEDRMKAACESFSGRTLSESQFQDAYAISGIIHREIEKSGSFRDMLTDYSHAFARSEKFDAMRGETILRDVYTATYNQTMNQTREALADREKQIIDNPNGDASDIQARALKAAETISPMIKEGKTMPFYQAYDKAAIDLSKDLNITQNGAKALMKDAHQNAHGTDLYEDSKKIEDAYHKPVREAEIAARKQEQMERGEHTRTRSRSMA